MLAVARGDVNNDALINILDVVYIINDKYEGGPEPFPNVLLGDADCSGTINILDAVYMTNYFSKGGPPGRCAINISFGMPYEIQNILHTTKPG